MVDIKMKMRCPALILGVALILPFTGCAENDNNHANLAQRQSCPPWVEYPADNHSNAESPYLDCTDHENLVNMLESPADLQQGRPLSSENGERETIVLKDYDENKSTSFKDLNAPTAVTAPSGAAGGSNQ